MSRPLATTGHLPWTRRLGAAASRWRRCMALYNLVGLLNPLFDLSTGGARRPVVHDIDATAPALRLLDDAYPAIRDEFEQLFQRRALPVYHAIDSDVVHSSARGSSAQAWRVLVLQCFGRTPSLARATCPRTLAVLAQVPDVYQAFFSVLEPGKCVPAHRGPSRMYLRYHLGLVVPETAPPMIRINDQFHVWQAGRSVLFDDSWDHEVINHSPGHRVVLIVDIARPLPWPLRLLAGALRMGAAALYAPRIVAAMERLTGPAGASQAARPQDDPPPP